jgi:hypothetical protein
VILDLDGGGYPREGSLVQTLLALDLAVLHRSKC